MMLIQPKRIGLEVFDFFTKCIHNDSWTEQKESSKQRHNICRIPSPEIYSSMHAWIIYVRLRTLWSPRLSIFTSTSSTSETKINFHRLSLDWILIFHRSTFFTNDSTSISIHTFYIFTQRKFKHFYDKTTSWFKIKKLKLQTYFNCGWFADEIWNDILRVVNIAAQQII